jgi:hypothetical protein
MKKAIFTICSIVLVCCAIMMSCTKDDNSATHVGYAVQSGYGTGNNPNPNGLPYVPPVTTTTTAPTNTTTPTVYSVTLTTSSGPLSGTISSSSCGGTSMDGTCSNTQIGSLSISFPTPPAAGPYTVVSSLPTSGQAIVSYNGNYASGGTVTITIVGGKNVATFNNVTGTTPTSYTLTGSFSCP